MGIEILIGKTLINVKNCEYGREEVIFTCDDKTQYIMYHQQDCCESVKLEEVVGDAADLIGLVVDAREETGEYESSGEYDSGTWTFYIIQTVKGCVTLRWLGTSSGYYSESVDFCEYDPNKTYY